MLRARHASDSPLLDVQVDADQDERPEHHGQQRREHGRETVQVHEVVVRVRDEHAHGQVDDDEDVAQHAALPKSGPRSRGGARKPRSASGTPTKLILPNTHPSHALAMPVQAASLKASAATLKAAAAGVLVEFHICLLYTSDA